MSSRKRGKRQKKPRYGDCRDNLPRQCPDCSALLINAVVKMQIVKSGTAHGEYECGAKLLAWSDPREGPGWVRPCVRDAGKVESKSAAAVERHSRKRAE